MVPPLIALEEHYLSGTIPSLADRYKGFPDSLVNRLKSLGDGRIKDMEAGELTLQVLSHAPINLSPEQCRTVNDGLAEQVRKQPKRFAGFATLPMREPKEAAKELERAVKELGFVGALVNNHVEGEFFDDEKYLPVFEQAVKLDVAIYIHPTPASDEMMVRYTGNYSQQAAKALSTFSWGWHTETGLHILRLFASGLFDKLPKLKIVIGHMGEMLPFAFDRILKQSKIWAADRERDLTTVWHDNIYITTSGYFTLPPMACLLKISNVDRILYSVDYPFSMNEQGLDFIKELQESGLVDAEQLDKICYKNAEKLLKVSVAEK